MGEGRESPAETRRAIMDATYRAIRSNGYAGLTMAAIAEEFEKSQSLIHYHYDTKEELLTAFLEYLIEGFLEKVESGEARSPMETLEAVVDALLTGPDGRENFHVALLELRARSSHEAAYREQFVANDAHLRELIAGLVEACVESGELGDVDAEALARRILITIEGARTRWVVLDDDEELRVGREMVDEQLGSVAEAAA